MRTEFTTYLSETEQRWEGTYIRTSIKYDYKSGKNIQRFLFRDITHTKDHTYTDHLYVTIPDKNDRKKLLNAPTGSHIFFMGYTSEYYKEAGKDYQIDGIKKLIVYDPKLIVKENRKQSINNLFEAKHSREEIALLLDTTVAKIDAIIADNKGTKKKVATNDNTFRNLILAFLSDGLSDNEISEMIGFAPDRISDILNQNQDRRLYK